jgi:spore germination protein YaaH
VIGRMAPVAQFRAEPGSFITFCLNYISLGIAWLPFVLLLYELQPEPFVTAVIAGLRDFGATGVNLDFEPCQDVNPTCTAQDAKDYATFLTTFTNGLHSAGFTVSVCVASWR